MIYFIATKDLSVVKIGYTSGSVMQRLSTLQTSCYQDLILLKTIDGSIGYECELHSRFESDHIRGEWFTLSRDLVMFIKETKVGIKDISKEEIILKEKRRMQEVKENMEKEIAQHKINRRMSTLGILLD